MKPRFIQRLGIAIKVLFFYDHFFVISIENKELGEVLSDAPKYAPKISFCCMQEYMAIKMIKDVAEEYDEDDMILAKAKYMGDLDVFIEEFKEKENL